MKLKKILALVLLVCVVVSFSAAFAGSKWIDVNGQNTKARLYKGWYYPEVWLLMKWSKDWTPSADEPVGAWVTNHFTWYANDYSADTWYGWDTKTSFEKGKYRIEEFMKIMRVSDDKGAWEKYQASGAYSASWGNYSNGVPKYIIFSDTVTVYEGTSNKVVKEIRFVNGVPQGLGRPRF